MTVIGIDTGGTFTDLVRIDRGPATGAARVRTLKVPSTPADPAEALLRGLAEILPEAPGAAPARVVHGTTVATNALLERRLARTALVTNAGLEDAIEIGRQARPDLYALHPAKPAPLVPPELRFGVAQRTAADGTELRREPEAELDALARALAAAGVEAIAIGLLHSYRDLAPELRVAARLAALGLPMTCSAALLPEIREVERFSTAVANAALTPVLSDYLERVARESGRAVLVMRSDGGLAPADALAREPVRTLLSGPAGGLVGAARAAARAGLGPFISIDVGGTSTDAALSGAEVRPAGEVGGVRVAIPALDIVSVGAGGGSIAWIDAGGALRVGPRSAGARPGPACYALGGEEPTLTDAAVVLGRLDARFFLGGEMEVRPERAAAAIERRIARPLGLSVEAAAAGIFEVALAATERAVRRVSVERGEDPRERALVAFGGAGGLLAAPLAERLGVRRVLVPLHPGLLSAIGMAEAPLLLTRSRALLAPLASLAGGDPSTGLGTGPSTGLRTGPSTGLGTGLDRAFQQLEVAVLDAMTRECGVAPAAVRLVREVDLRYEGQSYEIRIPYRPGTVAEDFHAAHERRNAFRDPLRPVEVVAAHVSAFASDPGGIISAGATPAPGAAPTLSVPHPRLPYTTLIPQAAAPESSRVAAGEAAAPAPLGRSAAGALYLRDRLAPGAKVAGPAVVGEYSGTTYVPQGWTLAVLPAADLLLERGADA